jgi:hypothetical protein
MKYYTAKMKYYTFNRESNNFSDIIADIGFKSYIKYKISWNHHLLLGFSDDISEGVLGYLILKYGDDIVTLVPTDYTPIANKDYVMSRKPLPTL